MMSPKKKVYEYLYYIPNIEIMQIWTMLNEGSSVEEVSQKMGWVVDSDIELIGTLSPSRITTLLKKKMMFDDVGKRIFVDKVSPEDVAKEFNIGPATVSQIRDGSKYPWIRRKYTGGFRFIVTPEMEDGLAELPAIKRDAVERMFENYNYSNADIADVVGISEELVWYIRKEFITTVPDELSVHTRPFDMSDRALAWLCYTIIYSRLSQEEIGRILGVSQERISKFRQGETCRPRIEKMGFINPSTGKMYTERKPDFEIV